MNPGPSRWPAAVVVLIALALLLGGIGVAAPSLVSAATIKARIDATSPDGSAETFPLERVQRLQHRAGVYGACFVGAGVVALIFFRRLSGLAGRVASDGGELLRDWRAGTRLWLREERGHVLLLLLFVAVACAARLMFIHQDMRYDEADSYLLFASRSLLYGLSDYPQPNNHLLNTFLMHVSAKFLGNAPWALRLPAFVAGVLVVPAAYWATRGVVGRWGALGGAGLAACSSFLIHYSVNARGYIFVVLAFLIVLGFCARLARSPNRAAALLAGVAAAAGFFAVPTMLFPFGACLGWLCFVALAERRAGQFLDRVGDLLLSGIVAVVLTVAAYGPVFIVTGPGAVTGNKYVSAPTWDDFVRILSDRSGIFAAELGRPWPLGVVLGAGALAWLIVDLRRGGRGALLVLALVLWCAAIVLVQRAGPYARVWTFLMPLAYAMGAAGLAELVALAVKGRAVQAAQVTLLALLCGWMGLATLRSRSPSLSPEFERFEAAADIAAYFKANLRPEDRVVSISPVRAILWYYMERADMPAVIMSHQGGSLTYAVVNVPLQEFNEGLRYWHLPTLEEERLQVVREFPGAVLYRIEPPLPLP